LVKIILFKFLIKKDEILYNNKILIYNQFYDFFESDLRNPNKNLVFNSKDELNSDPKTTARKLSKFEGRHFKVFLITQENREKSNFIRKSNKNTKRRWKASFS
jgi:hypothetical protein